MKTKVFPPNIQKHTIGFDSLFKDFETFWNLASRETGNPFPPHNVIKVNDSKIKIELAVAGYSADDISVEIEGTNLTISGNVKSAGEYEPDKEYLYKGISSKTFTKQFKVSEHSVVESANLADGILTVEVRIEVPESKLPKRIPVTSDKPQLLVE